MRQSILLRYKYYICLALIILIALILHFKFCAIKYICVFFLQHSVPPLSSELFIN